MDVFGERIKERRKLGGVTQAELAQAVGVSPQVISNWERGYTQPNRDELYLLAKNLDIGSDYLVGLVDFQSRFYESRQLIDLIELLNSDISLKFSDYSLTAQDKLFVSNILTLVVEREKNRIPG
ncbi:MULTISPECIES: helix-turn-helix transcriptional regulator [unclassified Paenibacillus]|uniref:helix-turn-helix domain-containing protein n=1 Tax=unclassified Paenibacillus TaxID=185978 RepID=UPI0024075A8E|nr:MULTISPECIES: helix-turn-helix transcriptional regulator [unclassified Paenibacillus]MDF9845022.1 transcriptional regulator with XRE-family HTH domain [Paenibacillus sp. PastF-2]MDF9851621.1 transcriptional regulator with XRE-family HTH domain [Paenibacillus sp. PastM-2]MDF9858205.1 transcriptional regulator with XRE-family HTH domain [Paenibacillus sp. PastF-1]MDH6483448.1 transcriptional regulator with XRE-family HTH domain [Paenibacillus sp. PastH-2]MDH6510860.1 transcriptional regulator